MSRQRIVTWNISREYIRIKKLTRINFKDKCRVFHYIPGVKYTPRITTCSLYISKSPRCEDGRNKIFHINEILGIALPYLTTVITLRRGMYTIFDTITRITM